MKERIKKVKLRNVGAILIAMLIVLTNFGSAYAASGSISSGGKTGIGLNANGTSATTNLTSQFNRNSEMLLTEDGSYAYCLDPLAMMNWGAKTKVDLLGYQGITQDDINYMAAVTDYCINKASAGSVGERYMIAQKLCWERINGKGFTANTSLTGISGGTLNAVKPAAHNFALTSGGIGKGYLYQSAGSQAAASFTISYGGYVTLTKAVKKNKHLTDLCPENYSLAGAEYGVFTGADGSGRVGTLTTTAAGTANTIKVQNAGRYYVKEVKAPKGFKLDPTYYPVDVASGQTATVNAADEPLLDPLQWKVVTKTIKEGSDKNLSVKGAEFTVKYYNTLKSIEGKDPTKTWTFLADDKGNVIWDDSYLKEGSEPLLKNENNRNSGLIGIYTIEETNAPRGLAKDDKTIYVKIEQNGNVPKRTFSEKPTFENPVDVADNGTAWEQIENPQTVSITINKVDKETGENKAQGFGSLAGAKYIVYWYNAIEDKDEQVGEIVTDEKGFGILEGLKPALYKVKEVAASAGYVIDKVVKEVRAGIKELNTANFNYDVTSEEEITKTEFSKTDITTGKELKGATLQIIDDTGKIVHEWVSGDKPYLVKGLTVGKTYKMRETIAPEGYVLSEEVEFTVRDTAELQKVEMKDDYTKVDISKTDFETGKLLKGAELQILDKDGKIVKEFKSGEKAVRFDRLPHGEYTLHEVKAPENYLIAEDIKFTVESVADVQKVEMKDKHKPEIRTLAKDKADGDKLLNSSGEQTVVDTTTYKHIYDYGKYTVKGKLIDKATGEVLSESEKTFTIDKSAGTVDVEFTVKTDKLQGKELVCYEYLYNEKGKLIAEHEDKNDKGQTVKVEKLGRIEIYDNFKFGRSSTTGDTTMLFTYVIALISSIIIGAMIAKFVYIKK